VAAIEKGRVDIAAALVEGGADANAEAGKIGHALEAACAAGMLELVRLLLLHGADVRYKSGKEGSALTIAARKGYRDALEVLLDHGAEAMLEGGNPLREAALNGHVECIELLLERNMDINHRTATQGRALEAALKTGQEDAVRFLVERGAEDKIVPGLDDVWLPGAAFNIVSKGTKWCDVLDTMLDRMDYSSQLAGNAFVSVARDGNAELLDAFLRNGADIKKHGPRALGVASVKGHLLILKRLFAAGVDVNEAVPNRGHAILRAANYGHVECVRALLDKGASADVVHGTPGFEYRGYTTAVFYSTPLQAACWGAVEQRTWGSSTISEEMVRMLLEAGADPNVAGARWFHPLNLAAYRGHDAIVCLLLEHGADASARGPVWGDNALQAAAIRNSIPIARLLLEHGAEVDGSGALQAACGARYPYEGNFEMVKLLLDHGADPNCKSEAFAVTGYINAMSGPPGTRFFSALECARQSSHRLQGDLGSTIRSLAKHPKEAIIQLLLDRGARDDA
jgi:ankyrin repeat protein